MVNTHIRPDIPEGSKNPMTPGILIQSIVVVLMVVLLLGVPKLAGMVASLFDYQAIDPDGSYAWISVHHIVQALVFIAIILVLNRFKPLNFGLGWGDKKAGIDYLKRFSLYFAIYTAGAFITMIISRALPLFGYPLSAVNILGQMGFQLLLSGPSEELIFRAFAITMLALFVGGRVFKGKLSRANIIAAVIFGLAHVGFSFAPFELRFSIPQVALSIALGLFYGDCYEKTGSVIYPMIMHSYTNILMVGTTILLSMVL